MVELLIEIFTEELPALPLLKNIEALQENWRKILRENRLESHFDFFYTPRRLVLIHKEFELKQPDTQIDSYGPPLQIAYDENKKPTKAMQSFLQKNGIEEYQVETAMKDGKEVLFYQKKVAGSKSFNLLGDMVVAWLQSLNFGKSMRWGDCAQGFIRPIRNICIVLDSRLVPCNAYGIQSSNIIVGHRQAPPVFGNPRTHAASDIQSYLKFLKENGVVLDQKERREIILEDIKKLEAFSQRIAVEIDLDLLAEIVAITEYPVVTLGMFEERFLKIPKEMIITSMKENQRYFALYRDNKLCNGFIVVSNTYGGDYELVKKGNEKVLRARLQDAEFFYENDLRAKMNFGDLSKIGFLEGAGNLDDKIKREQKVAINLLSLLQSKDIQITQDDRADVMEALELAKCDLLSQSVGEFPELQGIMGADFAKHMQKSESLCTAIREQYLPNGLDNALPSHKVSAIVNLAIKLDTLFTLFGLGKIPTGSKDPFALRRQAAALLRICHHFHFDVTVKELCALAAEDYKQVDSNVLYEFIFERIYGIFPDINASIVRSVLVCDFGITQTFNKILALGKYFQDINIKSVISTFKRVANILESAQEQVIIDETLFEESERILYANLLGYIQKKSTNHATNEMSSEDFLQQIQALFELKAPLDYVFDSVLIHTDDVRLRANRVALIAMVFNEFKEFGDMREIFV